MEISSYPAALTAFIAFFGALLQELAYWYELRSKLHEETLLQITGSGQYWVITLAMILASGIATPIWFAPEIPEPRTALLVGAAFPMILKKAIAATIEQAPKLGARTVGPPPVLRSYFRPLAG
jgi:hypothetical protein